LVGGAGVKVAVGGRRVKVAVGGAGVKVSVGPGVFEIRVHTGVEHRVFNVAKFSEAIYVLHAFEKKTRKTRSEDIDVARRRHSGLEARRRGT
jgi:phage-related protein